MEGKSGGKTVPTDARLNGVMVNHCKVSGTGKAHKPIPWESISRNARQDTGVDTLQVRAILPC